MKGLAPLHGAPARFAGALLVSLFACAAPAQAAIDIVDVYSSDDGEYQAIVLEDDARDGVDRFTGLTLSIDDAAGPTRSFTLSRSRLLSPPVGVDGRRRVLLATRLLAQRLHAQAELPDAFVPVDGGTLTLRAMPQRVRPHAAAEVVAGRVFGSTSRPMTDALERHPRALGTKVLEDADPWTVTPSRPIVREYWNAELDHYLLSVSQQEKAALDFASRRAWLRTGRYFRALPADAVDVRTVAVCRYYVPPPHGDTHLFGASADECARIAADLPHAILEAGQAFHVALPDERTGACAPEAALPMPASTPRLVPLYRAWNARVDTNHRYTTHAEDRDEMAARGWRAEGRGPAQVTVCVDDFEIAATPVRKLPPKDLAPQR